MHRTSRWRKKEKTGRHLFLVNGQRKTILPGDIVETTEQALGNQAKHYERLTPAVREVEKEEVLDKRLQLVKISRYRYNVVNPDNPKKPLNDKPLKQEEAEAMLGKLSVVDQDTDLFEQLDWDALIGIMEEEGIEILEAYETEGQLRDAIVAARG